eukprot:COSAG06_NODE_37259_length_437_cov_0.920118_1_plen_74_part_10
MTTWSTSSSASLTPVSLAQLCCSAAIIAELSQQPCGTQNQSLTVDLLDLICKKIVGEMMTFSPCWSASRVSCAR